MNPKLSLIIQQLASIVGLSLIAGAVHSVEKLPAALIQLPASLNTVFIAETDASLFHRFDRQGDTVIHNGSYYMSIGHAGPGKEKSGDKRTPIGVYFVTEQIDTSRLHEKYGVTAYPLDYPNEWDQLAGRYGDGIWVHGVLSNGGRRPERDTDGCVALPNEDLQQLMPLFEDNQTPVIVTRQVSWVDSGEAAPLRTALLARVDQWAASQTEGNWHTFLSLYDETFSRWQMDRGEWSSLKIRAPAEQSSLTVSDVFLAAYPDERGLYLSRFKVTTVDASGAYSMSVRLYWRRANDEQFRIVAEDVG